MEILKATVVEIDEKHFIRIACGDEELNIPISDDKPNEVKSAFNKLLRWIKEDEFELQMEEVGPDLFSQVASEYIVQLNREIQEVRKEMEEMGLVDFSDLL